MLKHGMWRAAVAAGPILATVLPSAAAYGAAVKGLPIADYNSDNGVGYGVHAELVSDSGSAAAWRVITEYYATTAGVLQSMVEGDVTLRSGIRIRGRAMYDRSLYTGYYGYGNTDAAIGYKEDTDDDYGYTYQRENPYLYFTAAFPVRPRGAAVFAGGGIARYGITHSPRVPADGHEPKLFTDAPEGSGGGTLVRALGGVTFDTRDNEFNALKGTYAEVTLETGRVEKTYTRLTCISARYTAPFKALPRLVLAGRVLYDQLNGTPPFFVQEQTGGLKPADAIGGSGTLRGIPRYRYKGNVKLVLTPEVRFRVAGIRVAGADLYLDNVFFLDAGNVWPDAAGMNLPLHVTYGVGPKFVWGEDFIVSACFGFWRNELAGVYVNTGHQF